MNKIIVPVRNFLSHPDRYGALKVFVSLRRAMLPGHELEMRNRMLLAKLDRGKNASNPPVHSD